MENAIKVLSPYDIARAAIYRYLKRPYLVFSLCCYTFILLASMAYILRPPSYSSEMSLVLPGSGATASVSIDEVGQVVSQTKSPYGSGSFSPRANYKEMLLSHSVLERAARAVGMSVGQFGQPKVHLTQQTSILTVVMSAMNPNTAQQKAQALYESLQLELTRLRTDEVERRDSSIENVLKEYRKSLDKTRNNIIDFQQNSLLVSENQFDQALKTHQALRERKMYLSASNANQRDYVNGLGQNLNLNPALAGKAFLLQSDVEFRGLLKELDVSTAQLSEFRSRWGSNHPKVIAEQARHNKARLALTQKSTEIAGPHAAQIFSALDLSENQKRAQLFADLIDGSAKLAGLKTELDKLEKADETLQNEIKILARESATLEKLRREFDLAEAVYTSAAARLEAGKADVFASYPVVQLLTSPTLATKPSSPVVLIGIAGMVFGFVFITSGVLVLCHRAKIIDVLLSRN